MADSGDILYTMQQGRLERIYLIIVWTMLEKYPITKKNQQVVNHQDCLQNAMLLNSQYSMYSEGGKIRLDLWMQTLKYCIPLSSEYSFASTFDNLKDQEIIDHTED